MRTGLFAGVLDPVRRIDLANDVPIPLVLDRDEAVLVLELGLQGRSLPRKGEERLLDLLDQCRIEIISVAVASGRKRLGFVDRSDLRAVDDVAVEHPRANKQTDSQSWPDDARVRAKNCRSSAPRFLAAGVRLDAFSSPGRGLS